MSEIGVNLTQVPSDILLRLVDATEEIRDLLRHKAGQENGTTQQVNGASHQGEESPEVADATARQPLNTETGNVQTDNTDNWPNDKTIAKYRDRCAKHKSECKKMQVELGCFIAHLGIVGGDQRIIERVESLRRVFLDPVRCLEKALDVTPDGRRNAIGEVQMSFSRLDDFICDFAWSPHQEDALYPDKVKQWFSFTSNGWEKILYFVRDGKLVKCLEFIHDTFFSELETAMGDVVEALATFRENSVDEWLEKQKIEVFEQKCEEYISCVLPPEVRETHTNAWLGAEKNSRFRKILTTYKESCNKMQEELEHLKSHYRIVGGDKTVVEASQLLQNTLLEPVKCLERVMAERPDERQKASRAAIVSFARLLLVLDSFQGSLYHQKHAFYFRKVKKWVACVRNGLPKLLVTCHAMDRFVNYICNEFLLDLNSTVVGASDTLEKSKTTGNKSAMVDSGNVVEELKTFGKESLPKFLVDQMERDTTRYVNLTTIATFFSSVTATTLQFTYAETGSVPSNSLRGVVNLFWFLSLVFSVSSAVNSLLGLTWRKSSIYDARVPPRLIRMWFDKAPMLFLITAAVSFVIGLNLFVYLSLQPRYVSFALNILTGLHGACLLAVTAWFIYQLKHDSVWAKWIRKVLHWIEGLRVWKWIKDLQFWRWIQHPRRQYRENILHLQRNFFWALGIDNCVARLNYDIDWKRDWPEPYLFSKLIRRIAYPIKKCRLVTKKALSDISRAIRAYICAPSHAGDTKDDVEMGGRVRREEAEKPEEISSDSPHGEAKNEYHRSLRKMFGEVHLVHEIMSDIERWENGMFSEEEAEQYIRRELWGYPALVEKFFDDVRPVLVETREKRRREREIEEQKDTTAGFTMQEI